MKRNLSKREREREKRKRKEPNVHLYRTLACQAPVLHGSVIAQFIHDQLIYDLEQGHSSKVNLNA